MSSSDLIQISIAFISAIASLSFLERLWFAKKHFQINKPLDEYLKLEQLPSITVCIPVRNERWVIEDCLNRVLANPYPKLEIIVLDDESVDNTSDIVRSFAHKGVRFIKGDNLPRNWIGKNHALKQLAEEAIGEYILFMSADTQLGPKVLDTLVRYIKDNKADMVSVMPKRRAPNLNILFGSLRFFWELILHSHSHPAVSTSAWVVKKSGLDQYANFFDIHKADIRIESALANYFYDQRRYRFLIANRWLMLTQTKDWFSQISTSIRTSSQIFEKLLWLKSSVLVILSALLLNLACWLANIQTWDYIRSAQLIIFLLTGLVFYLYACLSWTGWGHLLFILWPIIVLQELIISIISIIRHKLKLTSWKGRLLPKI